MLCLDMIRKHRSTNKPASTCSLCSSGSCSVRSLLSSQQLVIVVATVAAVVLDVHEHSTTAQRSAAGRGGGSGGEENENRRKKVDDGVCRGDGLRDKRPNDRRTDRPTIKRTPSPSNSGEGIMRTWCESHTNTQSHQKQQSPRQRPRSLPPRSCLGAKPVFPEAEPGRRYGRTDGRTHGCMGGQIERLRTNAMDTLMTTLDSIIKELNHSVEYKDRLLSAVSESGRGGKTRISRANLEAIFQILAFTRLFALRLMSTWFLSFRCSKCVAKRINFSLF